MQQNARLLKELVESLDPSQRVGDNDLIPEIAKTCKSMQQRILELCNQIINEDLIGELLHMNDTLNDVLLRHDQRLSQDPPAPVPVASPTHTTVQQPTALNTQPPPGQAQMDTTAPPYTNPQETAPLQQYRDTQSPGGGSVAPSFDMFAQARATSWTQSRDERPGYLTGDAATEMTSMDMAPFSTTEAATDPPNQPDHVEDQATNYGSSPCVDDHSAVHSLPDVPTPASPTAADMFDPLMSSASPWPAENPQPAAPKRVVVPDDSATTQTAKPAPKRTPTAATPSVSKEAERMDSPGAAVSICAMWCVCVCVRVYCGLAMHISANE